MAKKSAKSDRQAVIEEIRKKQKSAERRRGSMIIGVCLTIAFVIVAAAAYGPIKNWWDLRKFQDLNLSQIGAPASVCQDITTKKATGSADHVPTGQEVIYDEVPPAFGSHWNELNVAPAPMGVKFYVKDDRPELESLVHNLEHGYTILWYDETAAEDNDTMSVIEGLANKMPGTGNFRFKFKAVPWTAEDGEPFPEGQHIAITHWSKGGSDEDAGAGKQVGVWQFCSEPSGEALEDYMLDYPYTDSPEPDST